MLLCKAFFASNLYLNMSNEDKMTFYIKFKIPNY